MGRSELSQRADEVRHFNRFYTRQIGLLQEGILHSSFSLTEARVLYELAHRQQSLATHLAQELGIPGTSAEFSGASVSRALSTGYAPQAMLGSRHLR